MPNSLVSVPWVVIPVRAYKGEGDQLHRKNLRILAGKSLLTRAIETAKAALPTAIAGAQIVVLVEDAEHAEFANRLGVLVVQVASIAAQPESVVQGIEAHLRSLGVVESSTVMVLDPALALVAPGRLVEAAKALQGEFNSASLNREDQPVLGFTAARFANFSQAEPFSRSPHLTISVSEAEAVFIETLTDWAVADFFASRLRILVRTDVNEVLDSSHASRALALADGLSRHHVSIVINNQQTLNQQFFRATGAELISIEDDLELLAVARKEDADLVVLDRHLNTPELVTLLGGFCKVVTVEDFGEGAEHADLALNAMFENTSLDNEHQLSGSEVQLVPTDFETVKVPERFSPVVKEVLVCISGQDMSGVALLVLRALDSINYEGKVTVIRGLGAQLVDPKAYNLKLTVLSNVTQYAQIMKSVDLAVSSADFALSMLAAAGIPALAIAQNTAELLNSQARFHQGVITLGFGSLLSEETLAAHLDRVIEDVELRQAMHERALKSVGLRSNAKVANRLLRFIGF